MSLFRDKNKLKDRLKGKVTDDILNEFFKDDSNKSGPATDRGSFFDRPSSNRTRSRFGPSVDNFFNRSSSAGFPEDDMLRGSPRSGATDIRSHLNDLARRHPDLADQLRCFPGGGEPLYNSRSTPDGATSGESSQSGGVSNNQNQQEQPQQQGQEQGTGDSTGEQQNSGRDRKQSESEQRQPGNLSNHGLRNTVPLCSTSSAQPPNTNNTSNSNTMNNNADPNNRSPRAQSAPPQGQDPNQQQQRFVSKIEIQPNHNQHPPGSQQPGQGQQETSEMYIPTSGGNNENQAPPHGQPQAHNNNNTNTQQQQHEPAKTPHVKQPNVRHIPIFVEGRDAPIVNRDHEQSPFHHPPDPQPYHESPPTHHHTTNTHPRDRFREPIFEPVFSANNNVPLDRPFGGVAFDIPVHNDRSDRFSRSGMGPTQFGNSGFSKPSQRPSGPSEKVHRVFNEQPHHQHHHTQQHHQPQQQSRSQQQPQAPSHPAGPDPSPGGGQQHAPSPPPKKMSRPKTPLEMIQEVQAEVDKLREEIEKYKGTSRKEKEYIFLDEMLTRELLKLDNVDSGGNDEIRALRRATIKNIQATIAALEAKVPSTPSSNTSDTPAGETAQAEGPGATANENSTVAGSVDPLSSTPVGEAQNTASTNPQQQQQQQPTPMEVEQPKIDNNNSVESSGQQPQQGDQVASQTGEGAK